MNGSSSVPLSAAAVGQQGVAPGERWPGGPPSLRSRVLRHVLWPLGLAWVLGVAVSILVASVFTQRAFDRALLDDAYSVAANVRSNGNTLELLLSPREVGAVLFDQTEQVFFAVLWPDGSLLAGHAGLHAPAPDDGAPYRFSEIQYQGRTLRAVALRQALPTPHEVVMAETTQTRRSLLRTLLLFSILPQIGLLTSLAVWLQRAIAADVQPLVALERAVDARDVSDLTPVAATASTREVQRLGDAVNGLFSRIADSVQAQREFSGNVAHELRTPLAGIRALAEYGLAQKDPAVWREQLQRIVHSEERASHLVDQLLALARADEAQALLPQPVALDGLVRDAVLRMLPRADAAGIDIGARGIDGPVMVLANPALIEGVLNNLLDNALRYGAPVDAAERSITVDIVQEPDGEVGCVLLAVVDSGPGITAAQRGRLQQRWAQGEEGHWLGEGMGLGLSIITRYARLMHTTLELGPGPDGRGLAASLRLRVADPQEAQPAHAGEQPPPG